MLDPRARKTLNDDVRRLADGDRSAFEPVYAALVPLVRALCDRLLGGRDVDDAVQLAMIKIFDRAADFDSTRDAASWALAIAAWECKTLRRRTGRRNECEIDAASAIEAGAPSPEDSAVARDLLEAAQAALGALTEADRRTLRATMSDEAPAEISAPTFRKRRERAIARLREAWRRTHGS